MSSGCEMSWFGRDATNFQRWCAARKELGDEGRETLDKGKMRQAVRLLLDPEHRRVKCQAPNLLPAQYVYASSMQPVRCLGTGGLRYPF